MFHDVVVQSFMQESFLLLEVKMINVQSTH